MAGFFSKLKNLFTTSDISEEFYEELEERLVLSDVGAETSEMIVDRLKAEAWDRQLLRRSRTRSARLNRRIPGKKQTPCCLSLG